MVVRCLKRLLRRRLQSHSAAQCTAVIVKLFNSVWGEGSACERFWKEKVKLLVQLKYGSTALQAKESTAAYDFRLQLNMFQYQFFRSLQIACGLQFSPVVEQRLLRCADFEHAPSFQASELDKYTPRIRRIKLYNHDVLVAKHSQGAPSAFAKSESMPESNTSLPSLANENKPKLLEQERSRRKDEETDGWVFVEKEPVRRPSQPPQLVISKQPSSTDCCIS